MIDQHSLSLAVRWLHVAAMAFIGGGALLLWLSMRGRTNTDDGTIRAAVAYEQGFWIAAGLIVMTGVGNVAAFGRALLGPDTNWGVAFLWKLALVVVLLGLAGIRSLIVAQIGDDRPGMRSLRTMYGASTLVLGAIAALAVFMAHA